MRTTVLSALLLAAACGDNAATPVHPDGGGADLGASSSDMTPAPTHVAIVTSRDSTGASGAINTYSLADKKVMKGIDASLDGDTAVRVLGHKAYVLNKTHGTVRIYDDATFATPSEGKTGDDMHPAPKGFPQDLLPTESGKIYVSLNGNDAAHGVGILDAAKLSAGITRWVALPAAGKAAPFPGALYLCKGVVYVALDDIDLGTFAPAGNGRIAAIDATSDTVTGTLQLGAQNPSAMSAEGPDCTRALVAEPGPFGVEPGMNAGIERVDLAAKTSLGVLFRGGDLKGGPTEVQVASSTLAFATLFYDLQDSPDHTYKILSSARIVAFDPSAKKILGDVSDKAGYISFAKLAPDGQLLFGVNILPTVDNTGKLKAGLYVGKADGNKIPSTPIDLGQDPYAVAFD